MDVIKWLIFTSSTLLLYSLFLWITRQRRAMTERLDIAITAGKRSHAATTMGSRRQQDILRIGMRKLAALFLRGRGLRRMEQVQKKLWQAGQPLNLTVTEWFGLRVSVAAVGFLIGVVIVAGLRPSLPGLAICIGVTLCGVVGPEFWLSRRVRNRQVAMLRQLPSALDLLTVSVEAGLGFDQALARVSQKLQGPLASEFERALREIQLGRQRSEALQNIAERTGVGDIRTFVSAVVQADRLGIGLAQVLRVQSQEVRRKRRMDAEERAQKAPIKMLFPLVVFVFPALFITILGPAALHMMLTLR